MLALVWDGNRVVMGSGTAKFNQPGILGEKAN
jgi:hypothetical protein